METTANGIGIPNFPMELPETHMEPDVLETLFLSQYSLTDNSRRLVQTFDRNQSDENDIGDSDSHSYVNQEPEPEDDYDNGDSHSYVKQEPANENDNCNSHCFSHPSCFNIQVSPACNMMLVIMFTCTALKIDIRIRKIRPYSKFLNSYVKMVLAMHVSIHHCFQKSKHSLVWSGMDPGVGKTRRLFPLTRSRGWSWQ